MKRMVIIIVALVIGVALALIAHQDPGYVRIAFQGTTVETTLLVFGGMAIVAFVTIYIVLRALLTTRRVPRHLRRWNAERRVTRSHKLLTRGMLDLVEGRWREAEHLLTRQADTSEVPLLNYLAAAQAAQRQGAVQRADGYLKKAQSSGHASEFTLDLAAAELQLQNGEFDRALATLKRLHAAVPKHPKVMSLLLQLHVDLKNWEHLLELLPAVRKRHLIADTEVKRLEITAWSELLGNAAREQQAKLIHEVWARIPKALQENEALLYAYASQLIACQADADVIAVLRKALNRDWSDALIYLYGVADGGTAFSPQQLHSAEEWLKNRTNNPVLLLTLGRLALRNGRLDKARGYLEASIAAGAQPETYQDLGTLLEKLGEKSGALACYQKGLSLITAAPRTGPLLPGTRESAGRSTPMLAAQ
ncbi:MAG: HemY protein [Gammaproteobacteria bacterium]|nr:MAG: HemY protein [Gammaproteobacteria bacterium]TND06436.1 MAG: HemY protein [Gammaproteobacteria bacterium]